MVIFDPDYMTAITDSLEGIPIDDISIINTDEGFNISIDSFDPSNKKKIIDAIVETSNNYFLVPPCIKIDTGENKIEVEIVVQ